MMFGFTSQSATSIRQVQHVMSTVKTTDDKISQLRKDITTNRVANAGMTMKYVQQLEQQNASRKAWLVKNRESIRALGVHASKTLTPPRDSFMTPDGPRAYGRRGDPVISINDMQAGSPVNLTPPMTPTIDAPANVPPNVIPPGADLKRQQDKLVIQKREADKRRVELLRRKADMERQQRLIEEGRVRQAKMVAKNRIKEEMRKASEQVNQGSTVATTVASKAQSAVKRAQQKATDKARLRQLLLKPKPLPAPKPVTTVVVRDAQKAQQEQQIRTKSKMVIHNGVEFSLTEPAKVFVTRLYRQLLRREPDSDGLNYWVKGLLTKRMNQKQVIDSFMNSQEYKRKQQARAAPTQDKQRKDEAYQLANYRPPILINFEAETEDAMQKGLISEQAMREGEARYMQMEEEIGNIHARYLQGTIKQDLVAAKKMVDAVAQKGVEDIYAIIKKYNVPKAQPVSQGTGRAPRNINIPIHRQMSLNGMDKRSLAPIRTEQERGNQMGGNLGTLFPALRRSMQGVLKR